jgi:hypothetical protein
MVDAKKMRVITNQAKHKAAAAVVDSMQALLNGCWRVEIVHVLTVRWEVERW